MCKRLLGLSMILGLGIFLSCDLLMPGDEKVGSLIIEMGSAGLDAKTIDPGISMDIVTWDISGSGPGEQSFSDDGVSGGTHTQANLSVGVWTVTVEGNNAEGTKIAEGTEAFSITAGDTTTVSVTVLPVVGTGTLSVTLTWPTLTSADIDIGATLTSDDGTAADITFAIEGDSANYSDSTLVAGYHLLAIQLLDGATVIWGRIEAVRIIAGQTSTGTYDLTVDDINPATAGSMEMTIASNLKNPITISFSGQETAILAGTGMTVTASLDPAGTSDSYQWYLNGAAVAGATSASITIGSDLEAGNYWLDLVVETVDVLSSNYVFFTVDLSLAVGETGPAGGIIFYDDEADGTDDIPGARYLEAAPSDQSTGTVWGGFGTYVDGTLTAIGTGETNTNAIVAAYGNAEPDADRTDYAAKLCNDLELGGYDDWFLPSRDELNLMYQQKGVIGGFTSGSYWSSSEGSQYGAWYQLFGTGLQDGYGAKFDGGTVGTGRRVRAVRAF